MHWTFAHIIPILAFFTIRTDKTRHSRFHGRVGDGTRACAVEGCPESGEFRAPPLYGLPEDGSPPAWRWLCLDHVREFNAGYNFFEGMSADQIMAAQSPTAGWETESRAFRAAGSADLPPRWADFKDPMDALGRAAHTFTGEIATAQDTEQEGTSTATPTTTSS